jgi:hypothetical protein
MNRARTSSLRPALVMVLAVAILIYLYSSNRVTDTFADFPAEAETQLKKK